MAWHIVGLQMEDTPSRYGGWLLIYWISSCGQPIRDGPPTWGLVEGLTTHFKKKQLVTKYYTGPWNWWALVNMLMSLQVP